MEWKDGNGTLSYSVCFKIGNTLQSRNLGFQECYILQPHLHFSGGKIVVKRLVI